MKLIDETVNPIKASDTIPPFISLTCFSRNKPEIPPVTKIGSIIRIHRGDTKKYGDGFQMNCDIGIKSAWILFDPTESIRPMHHTGRSYTFVDSDKRRLREIRRFGEMFLKENDVSEFISIRTNTEEIDLLVMVLCRKTHGKIYDLLVIFDGEKIIKMDITKEVYKYIMPQDIVRIRGITLKKDKFIVNDYTNIMKISNEQATAIELMKKIEEAKKDKRIYSELEKHIPIKEKASTISEIIGKKPKYISLKDLFSLKPNDKLESKYGVSVNIVEIGPKKVEDWIQTVDPATREVYKIPADIKKYYKLQFFTKDAFKPNDANTYILYMCTIDGKGKEFLPNPELASTIEELKNIREKLMRPWFVLDFAIVPIKNKANLVFFIVNTKLKI